MTTLAKSGSILCVDDEPNILRSLHWMLHKEFDVMTAPDGYAALEMMRRHDFDVIVSDQRMPGMIGSELLRQACELAPRAMRILLTGYSDMQAILRSINEGEVFRFVSKPWSNDELTRTVREAAVIARTNPAPAAPTAMAAAAAATGERVLVLDDDPLVLPMVREIALPNMQLVHASSVAQAVALLDSDPVAVVLSDTKVGRVDATPLLKLLKQYHPEIVSIVLSVDSDVDSVIKLINQGQIYRFVTKPVKPAYLKLMLSSAVNKHNELKRDPSIARRHMVEKGPEGLREKLKRELGQGSAPTPAAARTATAPGAATAASGGGSLLGRLGGKMRQLFGN